MGRHPGGYPIRLQVGRGVPAPGRVAVAVGVGVTSNDGSKVSKLGGRAVSIGIVISAVGVGTGVGVICSKIAIERVDVGRFAIPGSVGTGSPGGETNSASVPPAKIKAASSRTPRAMIPGARLLRRAVSRVRA